MLKVIFILIIFILGNCSDTEKEYHPKAVVIFRTGDVRTNAKPLAQGDEISDKDTISVGAKSVCDIQVIESDTMAVVRIKEYSKFKLQGVQIGSTKKNNFIVDSSSVMLNVSKLGRKEEVNVVEGSVAMKVRVPELEKYSRAEIKQSKTLTAVNDALESKEIVVESGKSSQVPKSTSVKVLKETGLENVIKKDVFLVNSIQLLP